ncbi:MAG: ATP synthase F1 subunit delta, partial [Lachnospiraceae bacterium]|nr:ATP synthase F1 subunit delta [Lachnospiraceae bacterium]
MAKLIANTYGDALFGLAVEENKTSEYLEEFSAIHQAFSTNSDFNLLMNHPKILSEEKISVLESVFKGRVSDEMTGFLKMLIVKDRFSELEAIFDYFTAKVKSSLGIGVAYVTSAQSLNEVQKAEITDRLLSVTEYQKMEMNFAVDENI